MRSGEECRKRVSNKDGVHTAKKGEVVERGIAKVKICALLRKSSEKTMTLKSDQKHEVAVVPNQDWRESPTLDTSVPSEIVCSKVSFKKVFSEDVNKANYDSDIRDEKVTDEKVNDTAVTCDETFDLSYEEFIAEKEAVSIGKGTTPEPELAGEGGASENFLNLSMESLFTLFDDEESHDSGSIVFPEDEEESISLSRVSTDLASKKIDEEEAAERYCEIKSQLQMYPKRDPEGNDNAETTSTTIGVKGAPNPTDAVENIENFARMISNCQVTFADSIVTLSKSMRHVLRIDGLESEQVGCGTYGFKSNQDNVVPDPNAFCAETKVQLELTEMIACNYANFPCDESSFEFTDSCDGSLTWNGSVNYDCNVADFPFDEIYIESTHSLERSAAFAENNENGRVSNGNRNADTNAIVNGDDSVSDNSSLNKKVLTTDDDYLLQGTANFEPQNFDLIKPMTVTSKRKFGLWERLKERKNKANQKNGKKLSEETKMAIEMMLAAKDVNGERAETGNSKKAKDKSGNNGLEKLSIEAKLVAKDENGKRTETGVTIFGKCRSLVRFNPFVTNPLRCNKSTADAEPFRDHESYGDSSTMLENTLLPKENYPLSLGHIVPDWGSALSQVYEDGTIVDICADDDDPFLNANAPIFDGEQNNLRLDMAGGRVSSTEAVHETGDEAETSKLVDIVQVAGDSIMVLETNAFLKASVDRNTDSIKILEAKPLWKASVDPNTGRSYYYNRLTRETSWTTPPDFINR